MGIRRLDHDALRLRSPRSGGALHEAQQEGDGQEPHGARHEPAPLGGHADDARRQTRGGEPSFERDDRLGAHYLRNAWVAAANSGVVGVTPFTSAPNQMPWSNDIPSSW